MKLLKKILKFLKYSFLTVFMLVLLVTGGVGYWLYDQIVKKPAPEMTEEHISQILGQESPVYYSDGVTQFGILFDGVHRQYIKYDDIPPIFINALLAAEDDQFFHHLGIDLKGIARALVANYKAGHIVQGGSTITQQTAKNLFKREGRTIEAKFKELIQAFRLEYYFPKEKILEFYCNQFYVSGNGHGLKVAARYFFDKEPSELSLVECAFIAGSVKQPNYYNPFLKRNREDPIETKKRALLRVRYVLEQMRSKGLLTPEAYAEARTTDLHFQQGKMSYAQNVIMDLVKEGASSPILTEYLEANGISNISTSGVRIITTIDKDLQTKVSTAMRRHLSRMDVQLRGYRRDAAQKEYVGMEYADDPEIVPGAFVFGTYRGVQRSGLPAVELSTGEMGFLVSEGLARNYRGQLRPGDRVYVSVREKRSERGELLLNLERFPKLQGGAIVLQKGAIRALSSGMAAVHFNRATQAERNMGSTFKVFIYAAAMQLGWSPTDLLNNGGQTYLFNGNRPYSPSGHGGGQINMNWAGVKSMNRATVWLLYHLTDKLNTEQMMEMARELGMAPLEEAGEAETTAEYKARLRRDFRFNLKVSGMLEPAVFEAAVRALKTDLSFRYGEYERLKKMSLKSFQGYRRAGKALDSYRRYVRNARRPPPTPPPAARIFDTPQYKVTVPPPPPPSTGVIVIGERSGGIPGVTEVRRPKPPPPPKPRDTRDLSHGALYRVGGGLVYSQRASVPSNWQYLSPWEVRNMLDQQDPRWERIQLEGVISTSTIAMVDEQLKVERKRFDQRKLYTLDILCKNKSFRVMAGIQYTIRLARACGVESRMLPVLPLALGANVVTLSEMARMYEAMVTGYRYDPADTASMARLEAENRSDRDGLSIIDRIVTLEGKEVYRRTPHGTRLFDSRTSAAVGSILQNVVRYGTGKSAQSVKIHSSDPKRNAILARMPGHLPMMGKTGTANNNKNASFLGFVPVLAKDGSPVLELDNGYTVGVYVGYDRNKAMPRSMDGAHAALPAWKQIAQILLDYEKIGDRIDRADLDFEVRKKGLPLRYPDIGQVFVSVGGGSYKRGQIAPNTPCILDVGSTTKGGRFVPQRNFLPFWRLQQQEGKGKEKE